MKLKKLFTTIFLANTLFAQIITNDGTNALDEAKLDEIYTKLEAQNAKIQKENDLQTLKKQSQKLSLDYTLLSSTETMANSISSLTSNLTLSRYSATFGYTIDNITPTIMVGYGTTSTLASIFAININTKYEAKELFEKFGDIYTYPYATLGGGYALLFSSILTHGISFMGNVGMYVKLPFGLDIALGYGYEHTIWAYHTAGITDEFSSHGFVVSLIYGLPNNL